MNAEVLESASPGGKCWCFDFAFGVLRIADAGAAPAIQVSRTRRVPTAGGAV